MKHSNSYLFFNDGKCLPALEHYKSIFGGDLQVMKVGDAKQEIFKDLNPNLVMHGLLKAPAFQLMASDNMQGNTQVGDSVCMYIECSSKAEVDQIFTALANKGEDNMKPDQTFWGAYFGSLTDVYGVSWMLSFDEKVASKS